MQGRKGNIITELPIISTKKKKIGRPKGSKNRKTRLVNQDISQDKAVLVPELIGESQETKPATKFDIKSKLTDRELKFIEIYLTQGCNKETAMIQAGYTNYSIEYLQVLGTKIIAKYEQQAEDRRIIMRAMGYGEIKVIQMIVDSAENAKSEIVRLNAKLGLAKFLGLSQENIQGGQGVTIVIQGQGDQKVAIMQSSQAAAVTEAPLPLSLTK
jgi:hypothetical protein